MSKYVFLNDGFVQEENAALHFRDLSIQRGYGIFEFFKVINHIPVFLEDHLNRFCFSAAEMRLNIDYSKQDLEKIISELLQKNKVADTGVRITLTGGYSPDGYQPAKPNLILSLNSFSPPPKEQYEKGIKLVCYEYQRQMPQVKTIDYLMAIWLQPFVKHHNADDVLYHQNGSVTECPRSNFFIVTKDERIVTQRNNVLNGIVRKKLFETAQANFRIEERELSVDEIRNAKEAFITSTTKIILPVRQVDDHIFSEKNAVTKQLYNSMLELQACLSKTI